MKILRGHGGNDSFLTETCQAPQLQVALRRGDVVTVRSGDGLAMLLSEVFVRFSGGLLIIAKQCVEKSRTRTSYLVHVDASTCVTARLEDTVQRHEHTAAEAGMLRVLALRDPALPP